MAIIDATPSAAGDAQTRAEADTIFSCVFLGFLADQHARGATLRWDVDPGVPGSQEDRTTSDRERAALLAVLSGYAAVLDPPARVEAGASPDYRDNADWHVAIAGVPGTGPADGDRRSLQPGEPRVRERVEQLVADRGLREKLDRERGAYYGLVDHADNRALIVISSVRRLIGYGEEGGRWNRQLPNHGLIGYEADTTPDAQRERRRTAEKQAGSIEPTTLISDWDGNDHVCGYCHGMTWAIAQVACEFPGGTPYELGLGRHTHKLASCFGCTTFMLANGYTPSSMHLGRSESWVPLPEGPDAVAPFSASLEAETANVEHFRRLNAAWSESVARWMGVGAGLIGSAGHHPFTQDAVAIAHRLRARIDAARDPRPVANLFLDALTVHARDVDRLARVLA